MHFLYPSNQLEICQAIKYESECIRQGIDIWPFFYKQCVWINFPNGIKDFNCIAANPVVNIPLVIAITFFICLAVNIFSFIYIYFLDFLDLPSSTEGN